MFGKNVLKMTANDWIEEAKNWPWIKDEPIEHWPPNTMGALWDDCVSKYADKECIWYLDSGGMTFKELDQKADQFAAGLMQLGVGKGDHVGVCLVNYLENFIVVLALWKIGAVNIPVNPRYRQEDFLYVVNNTDVATLIIMDEMPKLDYIGMIREVYPEISDCNRNKLELSNSPTLRKVICLSKETRKYDGTFDFDEILDRGQGDSFNRIEGSNAVTPDDVSHIIYTSGTTGVLKGAIITHDMMNCGWRWGNLGRGIVPGDRLLVPVPLNHVYGLGYLVGAAWLGGACVLPLPIFEPKLALETLSKGRATWTDGVPTMQIDMLKHPDFDQYDWSNIRGAVVCAAPSPPWLAEEMYRKWLRGKGVIQTAAGMTEQPTPTVTNLDITSDKVSKVAGCICAKQVRPLADFYRYCIKDPLTGQVLPPHEEGELCLMGRTIFKGYYKNPEMTERAFDEDGWFHTGDIAFVDMDMYYSITGRVKEIYIQGGENIAPREVEILLGKHPKIVQAYVVGVPDERLGEVGAAFVQLAPGESMTEEEVKEIVRGKLAAFKVPRYVFFTDEFPLTASGKVIKPRLRERAVNELNL